MSKNNLELPSESDGQIFDFLRKNMPNKSKNNIKSLLANNSIYVNGKLVTKYDYMLHKNDIVSIKINRIKDNDNINILYEDKDIIVIDKPSGLLSISTNDEKEKTAYHYVMNYLKKKNKNSKVFVIHRLDRDTSGVLMFAKTEKVKHLYQDKWNDIVLKRGYLTIVEGIIPKETGRIQSYLIENKNNMVYSSQNKKDGKLSITNYKKISTKNNLTFLEVFIDTGRKNQIRVHMKDLGHPVVGDKKYGSKINPINRLALHAHILEIKNPITKKVMTFEAKMPDKFKKLV